MMNRHHLQRSSLTRITSYLAFLLAITWAVALFCFIQLHRLEGGSEYLGQLGSQVLLAKRDAAANQGRRNKRGNNPSIDVHIVFSTDCSGYQHWQAIASYYSFRRAGHLGPVTSIVSGCNPSREADIRDEFRKIDRNSDEHRLRLHFTPSFALPGKHYKYSNKPGGLHHWIMNRTTLEESVVALVDPDMMPLRPVVPQLGEGMSAVPVTTEGYRDLVEYRDRDGKVMLLRDRRLPSLPPRVAKGVAAGQHFGIGGFWASSGTKNARKDFKEFNLTAVCGANSPCLNVPPVDTGSDGAYTTRRLADENYAVGPVYIATASDWRDLLPRWRDFTPRVHAQYPKLLAEMYAFTMAAADMQLKFALSSSYMVSDPNTMSPTESWLWVDEYAWREKPPVADGKIERRPVGNALRSVCDGATSNSLPTETLRRLEKYGYGYYRGGGGVPPADEGGGALPTLLHYCQNYKLANHTFAKRKVPHDFFRCDGDPLEFDAEALTRELDSIEGDDALSEKQKKTQTRTGFMLCHLVPLMNMALIDFKVDVCSVGRVRR